MTAIITTREDLRAVLAEELPEAIKKANATNPEKLFTIREAGNKLGKPERTIRRMVRSGRIQATADRRYISQQSIDNYLNCK